MTRSQLRDLLLGLLVAAVMALAVLYGHVIERVDANQGTNTQALCALRADEQRRVASGLEFLAQHPKGIPGISAAVIRSGLSDEQRTITALRFIACP